MRVREPALGRSWLQHFSDFQGDFLGTWLQNFLQKPSRMPLLLAGDFDSSGATFLRMPSKTTVKRYARWFLRDPWHCIVGAAALAGPPFLCLFVSSEAGRVQLWKWTALVFYMAGSYLTFRGIRDNVRMFALQGWGVVTWATRLAGWWANPPWTPPRIITGSGAVSLGVSGASSRGTLRNATPSTEERLQYLEEDRDYHQAELRKANARIGELGDRLTKHDHERQADRERTRTALVKVVADGALDQVLGIWLLALGGAFSLWPLW